MSAARPPLDARKLEKQLEGLSLVSRLIVLDRVDSTNDTLRALAREGACEGTVVLADRQAAGRGRGGRTWHSPAGLGLYISVLLRPRDSVERLTRWTLAAAVAACQACRRTSGVEVEIKWPNDLLWDGRKLGGVLAETRTTSGAPVELVLGCGLNVAHSVSDFPDELSCRATSLGIAIGGPPPEREKLAAEYLRELAGMARELNSGSWHEVARRWERLAPGAVGQRVRVAAGSGTTESFEGVTQGLDTVGALRVRREDGRVVRVRLAESILPLEA